MTNHYGIPVFFEIGHNSAWHREFLRASLVYRDVVRGVPCPECGRKPAHPSGSVRADVDDPARQWPDALGASNAPFLLSGAVACVLKEEGVNGFIAHPVELEIPKRIRVPAPPPQYYYLDITGRMDIDLEASGIKVAGNCPVCFQGGSRSGGERYVPIVDTWDGSDIFTLRNYPSGFAFCTRKVLELARRHRWTNFRFDPMDAEGKYALCGSGIDYLGKQWPPAKWYPGPANEGKSLEQWLEQFQSSNGDRSYAAYRALLEIGSPAMPGLIPLLQHHEERVRREAAFILLVIHRTNPLADNALALAKSVLPEGMRP